MSRPLSRLRRRVPPTASISYERAHSTHTYSTDNVYSLLVCAPLDAYEACSAPSGRDARITSLG